MTPSVFLTWVSARFRPVWLLGVIPLFAVGIVVFGLVETETKYLYSQLAYDHEWGRTVGYPTIDPNVSITSYTLGVRATKELFSGNLPLWNHYEGLGTPLLGEMNSAALFPFTWLLVLPHGQDIEHALLQLLGGIGMLLFLRRFGLGAAAALTGAVLYEANGVFAWLRHSTFNPVAFLPWILFAFEWMRANTAADLPFARRLSAVCVGALAAALAVYAGFPEQVYLYSLLLVLWVAVRAVGLRPRQAGRFLCDVATMGLVALMLSAPVLLAFLRFLPESTTGPHEGSGFYGAVLSSLPLLQYLLPYVYGPIFAARDPVAGAFSGIGGYTGFLPVAAAIGGLIVAQGRAVKALLVAWIIICLGASHGWPPIYEAFMQLPLAKTAAAYRYLNPGWLLCTIVLAAMFVDRLPTLSATARRWTMMCGALGALGLVAGAIAAAWPGLPDFWNREPHLYHFAWRSFALTVLLAGGMMLVGFLRDGRRAAHLLGGLLALEAAALFFMPFLSHLRGGKYDDGAVAFLQDNVGFHRIVSTNGNAVGSNYGSAWGVPDLMFNDIPVPKRTMDYIRARLDPEAVGTTFETPLPGERSGKTRLTDRVPAYAATGVKYIVADPSFQAAGVSAAPVYSGPKVSIYEIENPRPYMSAPGCAVTLRSHNAADIACPQPAALTRLEVFMDGWNATVNGRAVGMGMAEDTFQTVLLPAGTSTVVFSYWPRGFTMSLLAAGVALLFIGAVALRRRF